MGTLYLVRHGQASFGADDYDVLSPRGHQQAVRLGEYWRARGMAFDAVMTGTLRRHTETLDGIAKEKFLMLIGVSDIVAEERMKAGVPIAIIDPRKIKEGIDSLKAEYARKGFSQSEIASRVQMDEAANTAAIHLLVDEGARLRIAGVLVEGNQAFPDRRIRKLLKTNYRWRLVRGAWHVTRRGRSTTMT